MAQIVGEYVDVGERSASCVLVISIPEVDIAVSKTSSWLGPVDGL